MTAVPRKPRPEDLAEIRALCDERHPHSSDETLPWLAVHELLRQIDHAEQRTRDLEAALVYMADELAIKYLRNWHLVRHPEHPHDLVEDCDDPVFVRMLTLLREARAAIESPENGYPDKWCGILGHAGHSKKDCF